MRARFHSVRTPAGTGLVGLLAVPLGLLLGLLLAGAVAAPAQAHAELLATTPKDGATVSSPPGVVTLRFDEAPLQIGLTVQVTGPSGRAEAGTPRRVGASVVQPLRSGLPAGDYRVLWRATSDDGHPVQGAFSFTASGGAAGGNAGAGGASPSARPTTVATGVPIATPAAASAVAAPTTAAAASGTGSSGSTGSGGTARWTAVGVAIVVLALIAVVIALRRPRRGAGAAQERDRQPQHR